MEKRKEELVKDLVRDNRVKIVRFLIDRERKRIKWESYDEYEVNGHKQIVVYNDDLTKGLVTRVSGAWEKIDKDDALHFEIDDLEAVPEFLELNGQTFKGPFIFSMLEELTNEGVYHLNGNSLYKKYKEDPWKLSDLFYSLEFYELSVDSSTKPILMWNPKRDLGIIVAPTVQD